jgi:hypothetical protein
MRLRFGILGLVFLLLVSFPAQATKVNKADLEATHILTGTVADVQSFYGANERGDQIILSRVKVKAAKWIKGDPSATVEFLVEGGSVGDIALRVSDIPEFEKGQQMRLLLKRVNGEFKYHDSEIQEDARFKPAKPAAGCCKTYAAWPGVASYRINPAGADAASAVGDVQAGADAWNVGGAVLNYAGSTSKNVVSQDYENTVFFNSVSGGSAIAVTYLWYYRRTQVMIEFDMYFFEDAWRFFGSNQDCTDGFFYETIAAHEFGHAIGIDHNRCVTSIMYPYASYCNTNTVTAQDLDCKAKLYQ